MKHFAPTINILVVFFVETFDVIWYYFGEIRFLIGILYIYIYEKCSSCMYCYWNLHNHDTCEVNIGNFFIISIVK